MCLQHLKDQIPYEKLGSGRKIKNQLNVLIKCKRSEWNKGGLQHLFFYYNISILQSTKHVTTNLKRKLSYCEWRVCRVYILLWVEGVLGVYLTVSGGCGLGVYLTVSGGCVGWRWPRLRRRGGGGASPRGGRGCGSCWSWPGTRSPPGCCAYADPAPFQTLDWGMTNRVDRFF